MNPFDKLKLHHIVIFFLIILFLTILCTNATSYPTQQFYRPRYIDNFSQSTPTTISPITGEIILYYATWCGYSKKILPEWEKFEAYVKQSLPSIKATRMLCEGGLETQCMQRGIQGYPTIVFYKQDGTSIPFDVNSAEDRNFANLQKFVQQCISS